MDEEEEALIWQDVLDDIVAGRVTNLLCPFCKKNPVFIDKQQNFRVEIDIPDSDVHKTIQQIYGPLFIWVVLDGYLTRDVQ